ncbi:P-loop containing nucleoside triphosphate hydrolase protein [Phyllosticta citribraziliensis]|uniref:RNA helicase n=1 Tax=Phyllosticta citribraziliensis TaxID=989973 RepID=A0ABR1M1C7_9PEZI
MPEETDTVEAPAHKKNSTTSTAPPAKKRKRDSNDEARRTTREHRSDKPPNNNTRRHGGPKDRNDSKAQPNNGSLAQKRARLLPVRQALPIWSQQETIRASLRDEKDVMILAGETGSGKSTQVPQFLLGEPWLAGKQIAITQPRRVAAISLARRVAEEMGSTLGNASPRSTVGYSVRFDVSVAAGTRIKYLTEGMLLQELLRDPWLKAYGCVVVDEVHERSVNVDLVLGFLRRIVCGEWRERRGGRRLKVVVMSATADTERLLRFFDEGFREVQGKERDDKDTNAPKTAPEIQKDTDAPKTETEIQKEEASKKEELGGKKGKKNKRGKKKKDEEPQAAQPRPPPPPTKDEADPATPKHHPSISTCHIEGRMYPVRVRYLPEPTTDILEASLKTIFEVHVKEPLPGDILVFLTGQDAIEALEKLVNEYAESMSPELPKIQTLPLFAALPQLLQQRVFQPPPPRTRKVILSTNIAETSVTVPGVRHVVDCGKSKVKQFRPALNLDSLLVKPISQSAAIQRKGRAGREAPGTCYRLYTEAAYASLQKDTTPEILRCDLSAALLMMKARGVRDLLNFPFLDSPSRESLEKALLLLYQLGALEDDGEISAVGRQIAQLPLTPTLGRCLVEAATEERQCIDEMIDIVASLSVENVFLNLSTEEQREEAELARRDLFRREGDHLTLLATVQAYAAEHANRKAWCERRGVNHRAMQNVMDVRKQLRALCTSLKLLSPSSSSSSPNPTNNKSSEDHANNILLCVLAGFAPNTARLVPDGSYRTMVGNQTVTIHPSSVLFGRKTEAIVFSEFVFTNKSYARGVSAVRLDWVGRALGAE